MPSRSALRPFTRSGFILLVAFLFICIFAVPLPVTYAAGVVTNCSSYGDISSPGTLAWAVNGGGIVTFSCDGTIIVPSMTVSTDTTIDGSGHLVTLSGNRGSRPFTVQQNITFTLNRMNIVNGWSAATGGAINNSGGTLIVSNSTLSNNIAGSVGSRGLGAAIYTSGGTVTLDNSILKDNWAGTSPIGGGLEGAGGAVYSAGGKLTIRNTTLSGNFAGSAFGTGPGGAIYNEGGTLAISQSSLSGNVAALAQGGAIYSSRGLLNVSDTSFSNNLAVVGPSFGGGAICNDSGIQTTISNSRFIGNSGGDSTAGAPGGAILNISGPLTIANSIFSANRSVSSDGGAIQNLSAALSITNSSFSNNTAGAGGAIDNLGGTLTINGSSFAGNSLGAIHNRIRVQDGLFYYPRLTIDNSTFSGNSDYTGGAIFNVEHGTLSISNSTFSGNSAFYEGGAIFNANPWAPIFNSTFSGNSAPRGSTLSGNGTIGNSIVVGQVRGGECYQNGSAPFRSLGHNLEGGVSCGFTAAGDQQNADPNLGPLQDNGGPTFTMALLSHSPAIGAGANCLDTRSTPLISDQRGFPRWHSPAICDIGAYEYSNPDTTPPVITPLVTGTIGSNGWYTSDVTLNWSVIDPESGVSTSTGCGSNTYRADTAGTVVTCSATNGVGLSNSVSITIKIDRVPPSILAEATAGGNVYHPAAWTNQDVTVGFTCSDGLSGVATVSPPSVLRQEGAGQSAIGSCSDGAGNAASVTFGPIHIDKTPPIFPSGCPNAGPFERNTGPQAVGPIAVDAGISGLDKQLSQLTGTVDTTSAGTYTTTFTATDLASNMAVKSCSYEVANPVPVLSSLNPAWAQMAGVDAKLTISGTNFVPESVVRWGEPNGTQIDLATSYNSSSQLTAVVPAQLLSVARTVEIRIYTPAPGGGTSTPLPFFVIPGPATVIGVSTGSNLNPSGGASASVGGTGPDTPGSVTATGTGAGTVSVAEYSSNPRGVSTFATTGAHFDIYVAHGSSFSALSVVACNLHGGAKVRWWDGTSWVLVSPQSYSNGCVTMNLSNTSTPTIAQLTGTVFGVEDVPPAVSLSTVTPSAPMPLSAATLRLNATFDDPAGSLDGPYTLVIDWGNGQSTTTMRPTTGLIQADHAYPTAGVFIIKISVTDSNGATGSIDYRYVVIYDPAAGFVTGGGWINSPAGAYVPDPALAGRASFGFVSRYLKGASVPSGQTEFQFEAAGFTFRSTSYQWLVVAGAKAQFKGSGLINSGGDYGFVLTAVDGQVNGGDGSDKFRIKIWDKFTGSTVYDNQLGADDTADPSTIIGGGSITIHS